METFLQALRSLGPSRLAIMGGVVLALVGFFIFLLTRLGTPQMALLYGELDTTDSARIVSQLTAQDIPFELRNNGTEVYVPNDRVGDLRMSMADEGLPSGGSIGYEIFDDADALGSTNFVQNVNLVRALEGELSRTIRSLESVRTARVHLVMPKRELFSRESRQPSASVILQMAGSRRLGRQQVSAVQHLIAAAVPNLNPNRVSIVDERGTLLAAGFEDDSPASMALKADERRRSYENRLARTIEDLVEKTVGFGKVRAEVTADMDFDRINTSQEAFDPDGQVVRSTQTIEESATSQETEATPPVSVATNLPDAELGAGESAGSRTAENRTEETVNFEISKKVTNHVRETGIVNRLSVAVLVDGTYARGEDGETTYEPRGEEDMELLATLVRGAIGYNADRGDTVEVVNMRFHTLEEEIEEELQLFFGLNKNDLLRVAEILVLSIVSILVILLIVRPLVARAFEAMPAAMGMAGEGLLAEQAAAPALAGPGARVPAPGEGVEEEMEEMIDLDRVEGRVKASSVKKVGEIVEKHPDEAISIIRSWMYHEA